ncbi:hypothetical protein ABZZ36_34795 [Actinacidiphila glaucinigra]|uniref:hypothetical protein n=1 Tax=Actinacidiphila glaucinigra TaxID=235986 RepID=UPI00339E5FC1
MAYKVVVQAAFRHAGPDTPPERRDGSLGNYVTVALGNYVTVHSTAGNADGEVRDKSGIPYPNAIRIPARNGKQPRSVDGFQVGGDDLGWFGQLLARTGTAGLTAFTGGGQHTAQYLTARQGQRHYTLPTFAATSSVDDAQLEVGDTTFIGTDHVFRMGSARIEAFSGMANDLYELIKTGRVEDYRQAAFHRQPGPHSSTAASNWNGPISFHADGTAMALSILPIRKRRPL